MEFPEWLKNKLTTIAEYIKNVYDNGVVDGRKQEWSDFWDALQVKGARTDYYYGFYSEHFGAWNDKNFKPKYDFKPTDMSRFMRRGGITNLSEICRKQGIVIDSSRCAKFSLAFANNTNLLVMCPLDISKITSSNNSQEIFAGDTNLRTIEKLTVAETTPFNLTFNRCDALQNITIEGVIGRSISFPHSPLSVESIKNIITHLKDYSGTDKEYTYTLTLKADCWTNLEAEGETSPDGTTWIAYVESKGWSRA